MKLVRYNPLNDYAPANWGSFLNNFLTDEYESDSKLSKFAPNVDIAETEKAYEIHVAVPGMKKEDFHIDLQEKTLTVSGERKWKEEETAKNFHRVETQYGSFSRSFNVPDNVNAEKISAAYNNGILEIELPKDAKKELKSTIKVR
ncbi:MAG: Hsp20/alpha crystallin family protein [Cyclobacteriaceae bacterium]|nr:Hsp20/alpha crystallin family protein [Cyclobacteriaceae bacterium]